MVDRREVGVAQVRAHRFAREQTDEALTMGTTSGGVAGRRSRRNTLYSYAMAVVILAGAGVLAIVRPAPDWRAATVLVDSASGAVFVNRAGTLHPALNLASALLAAPGSGGVMPMEVSASDIASASRGALIGIPGAPDQLPTADRLVDDGWSICDETTSDGAVVSTELIGAAAPGPPLGTDTALLVAPTSESDPSNGTDAARSSMAQLLWSGHRMPVDLTDVATVQALGLAGVTPRPVDAVLLAALPFTPPIVVAAPAGSGDPPRAFQVHDDTGRGVPVGAVLRVVRADGTVTLHLVHSDGVELINPLVADLLRYRTGARLVTIEPRQLAVLPSVGVRTAMAGPVPAAAPRILAAPMVCATWGGAAGGWDVVVGAALPTASAVVTPAASGAQVDRVRINPGAGALVRRGTVEVDDNPDAAAYVVTDLGVAHPVTLDAAVRLGLVSDTEVTIPAVPAVLIDALTPGPALDIEAAARTWDYRADTGPER